jgi:AIG1 family
MTDARLLFLGKTGVGKSSLINFLAGEERCDTDSYRPCTKKPVIISVRNGENEFELIDTPGLCESGDELDFLYLDMIDRYLLDQDVFPHFVFKSDDTRIRTEDYQFLKTLLKRYGNRILTRGSLMLTFAGNLTDTYDSKIHKRVTLITGAIYGIQISMGMELFPGFERITLLDSKLKSTFEINNPDNGIVMKDLLAAIELDNQRDVSTKLGVLPETSEGIIAQIMSNYGQNNADFHEILSRLNRFPFHNIIDIRYDPTERSLITIMLDEPKTVYDLAQRLSSDNFDESSITIEGGLLTYRATFPYRKIVNSDKYADCVSIVANASKSPEGHLQYDVFYKIVKHIYREDGQPDVTKMLTLAEEYASILFIKAVDYVKFSRLIGSSNILINNGLIAFRQSIEESLSNEAMWQ